MHYLLLINEPVCIHRICCLTFPYYPLYPCLNTSISQMFVSFKYSVSTILETSSFTFQTNIATAFIVLLQNKILKNHLWIELYRQTCWNTTNGNHMTLGHCDSHKWEDFFLHHKLLNDVVGKWEMSAF